jgi:hypothetical protein
VVIGSELPLRPDKPTVIAMRVVGAWVGSVNLGGLWLPTIGKEY